MRFFLITIILVTYKINFAFQFKLFEQSFCYDNDNSSKNDVTNNQTKVIDVTTGSIVHLWCHYCNDKADFYPKLWYYRPRGKIFSKQKLKELDINDNFLNNNISMTLSHILNLNYFTSNNSGIYTCKSHGMENVNNFIYVLDGVFYVEVKPKVGAVTQWRDFKRSFINPINKKFKISKEEPYNSLRNRFNIILSVYIVWDNWSVCEEIDGHQKGIRKRLGRCRVGLELNNTTKVTPKNIIYNSIISYLSDDYDVPCRSLKLNDSLPEVSNIIRNIPEFEAQEPCSLSQKTERKTKKNKGKHKNLKQVMEDSHVTLMCNGDNSNSDIVWYKDNKLLKTLYGNNFNKKEDEPHISIDALNSLHIMHISKNEEGNYSCSINGKNVKQFEVIVVSKPKLLNQEFIRYSIYLGFVLSLTMTCYCAGVCVAWHRRASFADPLNLYKKKPGNNFKSEQQKLLGS